MAHSGDSRQSRSTKVVLLGNTAVGKSCLSARFVRGKFLDYQEPTIGAAFSSRDITLPDGTRKTFDIWDTAGQERYRSLAPMYYRGAAAAIIVYDVSSKESFDGARSWVAEVKRNGEPNAVLVLAGNKADLPEDRHEVDQDVAREFADAQGAHHFLTSAKKGLNVEKMFECIAEHLPKEQVRVESGVDFSKEKKQSGRCC